MCIELIPTIIIADHTDFIKDVYNYYYSYWELDILKKLILGGINENEKEFVYALSEIIFKLRKPKLSFEYESDRNPVYDGYYFLFSKEGDFINHFIDWDNKEGDHLYLRIISESLSENLEEKYSIDGDLNEDFVVVLRTSLFLDKNFPNHDVPNMLINEILLYLEENTSNFRDQDIDYLLGQNWSIFVRISLTAMAKDAKHFVEKISEIITNEGFFQNEYYRNEINYLLEYGFQYLEEDEKQEVASLILNGPTQQHYHFTRDDFSTDMKYISWKEEKKRKWILEKIRRVDRELISGTDLEDYYMKNAHIKATSTPNSIGRGLNFGEFIQTLSSKDLIVFLKKIPTRDKMIELNLKNRIIEDPLGNSEIFNKIKDVPRVYLEPIFFGLETHLMNEDPSALKDYVPLIDGIFSILPHELILLNKPHLWQAINYIISKFIERFSSDSDILGDLYQKIRILFENLTPEDNLDDEDYPSNILTYAWSSILGDTTRTYFKMLQEFWNTISNDLERERIINDLNHYLDKFKDSLIFNSIALYHFSILANLNEEGSYDYLKEKLSESDENKYQGYWESFLFGNALELYKHFPVLISEYEVFISKLNDDLNDEALNIFTTQILLEFMKNNDLLICKLIELSIPEIISNMMRLTLHLYEARKNRANEIEKLLALWDFILTSQEIEMKPYEEKYKVYRWYPSFFKKLSPDEKNLQNLILFLKLSKGRIGNSNSTFKELEKYTKINGILILKIIRMILESTYRNDIYKYSFDNIINLMEKIEEFDNSELQRVINAACRRGNFTIEEKFKEKLYPI